MGGCLSVKFEKNNKVSPMASTTETDEELVQRAKRYLKDRYQSSLQSSYTQTGASLTNLQRNSLKLDLAADGIAPGVKIQSVEAAEREKTEGSVAQKKEKTFNRKEEKVMKN